MQGSLKYKVVILVLLVAAVTISIGSFLLQVRDNKVYPSNIALAGIAIGDLERETAYQKFTDNAVNSWGSELILKLPDKTVYVPLTQWGIDYNTQASIEKIDSLLNRDSGIGGIINHSIIRGKKQDITPVFSFQQELLRQKIAEFKKQYDKPACNARVIYVNGDDLEFLPHKKGYTIDINNTYHNIYESLVNGYLGPVDVAVKVTSPRIKLEDVNMVRDVLGIEALKLRHVSPGISEAVRIIDGSIIMPGESIYLSENDDTNRLYKALQGVNSTNRQWIEKSICLAFKQAGIYIEEQTRTIKNNLKYPVMLSLQMQNNTILVRVFGYQTDEGKEVAFISEKEELLPQVFTEVDSRLAPGERQVKQPGKNGIIIRKYRVITKNGTLTEKELLSEEIIPARDTVILIGTGTLSK